MAKRKYDVFILSKCSKPDGSGEKTRDYELAKELFERLRNDGVSVFFSGKDIFNEAADEALMQSKALIVVGTCSRHLNADLVRTEWESFARWILVGEYNARKIYNCIEGMAEKDLPSGIYGRQTYTSDRMGDLVYAVERYVDFTPRTSCEAIPAPSSLLVKVGDIIEFGRYPQGARGEVRPLEWRVLEVDGDTALLLTEKCIDCLPYNKEYADVTWRTCTLRKWMNKNFIRKAFDKSEQSFLMDCDIINYSNPDYGARGGSRTWDRVFALSMFEADRYFKDDKSRASYPTDYAKSKKVYVEKGTGSSGWWLRSPGYNSGRAAYVFPGGGVFSDGGSVDDASNAVRPACRINL